MGKGSGGCERHPIVIAEQNPPSLRDILEHKMYTPKDFQCRTSWGISADGGHEIMLKRTNTGFSIGQHIRWDNGASIGAYWMCDQWQTNVPQKRMDPDFTLLYDAEFATITELRAAIETIVDNVNIHRLDSHYILSLGNGDGVHIYRTRSEGEWEWELNCPSVNIHKSSWTSSDRAAIFADFNQFVQSVFSDQ